jgi:hypothetical protein
LGFFGEKGAISSAHKNRAARSVDVGFSIEVMMRLPSLSVFAILCTGCASPCAASAPPAFDRFRSDLQAESPLQMTLMWPDPIRPIEHPVTVVIGPEGASATTGMGSVKTDGSTVKIGDEGLQIPLPDLADEAAELFDELRSGLAESTWTSIEAPLYGPTRLAADATWAKVKLPFDWTTGERMLLAVDGDSGALRMVLIETTDPPLSVTSRPPRGGPRTVRLSEGEQLKMVVRDYVRP